MFVLSNCNLIVVNTNFGRKISFVPDWNCALCSPRTEIVGPCSIAAAVDADDLLTSLIGIGVNGVNELPVYIKQTKNRRCQMMQEQIQLVNNKSIMQRLTFTKTKLNITQVIRCWKSILENLYMKIN